MRRMSWIGGGLCLILVLALARPASMAAQETDAEAKAKLEALKKQIEALQKKIEALHEQEKAILKEAEKKAEEKDYYSKLQAEVKGRLQKSKNGWLVIAKGTTWRLDFGDKKEWIELAKTLEGKTVLVTGSAVITTAYPDSYGAPGSIGMPPMGPAPGYGGLPPGPGTLGGGRVYGSPFAVTTWTLKVEKLAAQ
jgi:hypothetical protein